MASKNAVSFAGHGPRHRERAAKREEFKREAKAMCANDFREIQTLGKGGFGKVFLMEHKSTAVLYGVKVLDKLRFENAGDVEQVAEEKHVLQIVDHPFCIKLHYAFQDASCLYLVMNYVGGGNLNYHLRVRDGFSEESIFVYAGEVALVLAHLHELQIIYRDLKSENIMLGMEGHIQLVDFGLAKHITRGKAKTICGTPSYFAPEMVKEKEYSFEVDWWTYGVLLYEMLTRTTPFDAPDEEESFENILTQQVG
jgi:serine/threonine protein kinase